MIWKSKATDGELMTRLARGDERAFTILYRRHQRAVYGFALLLAGSESTAADATQEAFIELLKVGTRFDPAQGTLAAWLCGVARNCVRRHRRDFDIPVAQEASEGLLEASPALHASGEPLASLERSRATAAVRNGLARIEPHYREVLILCALQEFSYAEAAAICGIEVHLVRSRLARGKIRLAELLRDSRPWQQRQAA
jgi:RNA polymerase sigma-70 factor (ECF subfamily)